MNKFNVGDRVLATGNISGYENDLGTIERIDVGHPRNEYLVRFDKDGSRVWAKNKSVRPEKNISNNKIVITQSDNTTTANLYDGNKVIKSAEAKCSPSDTYDFNTGANLAYDRLMGRTSEEAPCEATPEPQKPREPITLYCVKEHRGCLTKGKTYILDADGKMYWDFTPDGMGYYKSFADLEDTQKQIKGCLVECVKRPAKVGEWVLLVKDPIDPWRSNTFHKNDIVKITHFGCMPSAKAGKNYLGFDDTEYLVLDGYKPEPEKCKCCGQIIKGEQL